MSFWQRDICPATYRLDLTNASSTVYTATMAKQLDIWIGTHPKLHSNRSSAPSATSAAPPGSAPASATVASPYAPILQNYYGAIGNPSRLPDWALGFWASKERYSSQTEIVDVVKNYGARGIAVDVLVIDWKHYQCVGDWGFTLATDACWPTPAAMVVSIAVQQTWPVAPSCLVRVEQCFYSCYPVFAKVFICM
jgi:alpha-glucosidase (family GH31 glycosyl hydrolase)